MADLVAIGTGNLTSAGTWGLVDSVSKNVSTNTGSTSLTTGNLDSATFVPGAVALLGVAVKLVIRGSGSPSNTISITLRNSTTSANAVTVTANVSDLPFSSSNSNGSSQGGWHFFQFSAAHTPNGTDSYLIRVTLSATTTNVSLATNGTANNWQRLLVRSTTQAPAAGDSLYLAQLLDGSATPATATALVVTMDSTAATDYGAAATDPYTPALSISKGCTLIYGAAAATNYLLRLSGNLAVYAAGTLNIGTVATPIPRDSTAVLEFDCAASGNFGLYCWNQSIVTMQGLSRTSGKNAVWALLTADLAAAGTAATIDTDTGWLSGDQVAFAPTARVYSEYDAVTLTADATSTGLAWTGGVTFAHKGTVAILEQAEVVLLTRNVKIRSTLSTAYSTMRVDTTATVDLDWVEFRYMGSTATTPGFLREDGLAVQTGSGGTCTVSYCVFRDGGEYSVFVNGSPPGTGVVTLAHLTGYRLGLSADGPGNLLYLNIGSSLHSYDDIVSVGCHWAPFYVSLSATASLQAAAYSNFRSGGSSNVGIYLAGAPSGDLVATQLGPFVVHAANFEAGVIIADVYNATFKPITSWRNGTSAGVHIYQQCVGVVFEQMILWGNATSNLYFANAGPNSRVLIQDFRSASETGFTTGAGIKIDASSQGGGNLDLTIQRGDFGTVDGTKIAHTNDLQVAALAHVRLIINDALFTAATLLQGSNYGRPGSMIQFGHFNRTADHRTYTPLGSLLYETTTFDVTPALKMTPLSSARKLESAGGRRGKGFLVPVLSGATVTVTVKVQKDGSYSGNAPRLILAANPALGVNLDTVGDTLSVGASTWETLTYTTPAAAATGVWEFVVDCDGTAGSVFVDTWAAA